MKLGLGTVQFGTPYGIANPRGIPDEVEVGRILALAEEAGLQLIDTAIGYGNAESVLGRCLPRPHGFSLVTKTPSFRESRITVSHGTQIRDALFRSLDRLGESRIYGLLAHHAGDLLAPGGEYLIESMTALVSEGHVDRIGVSVYNGAQIDAVLALFTPGIVQLPASIVDRRLIDSGHIARLRQACVEVHVRSAFLQGALLMPSSLIPPHLEAMRTYMESLDSFAEGRNLSRLQLALGYLREIDGVSHVIVGVTGSFEFKQIIDSFRNLPGDRLEVPKPPLYDESLLNPSLWPQNP